MPVSHALLAHKAYNMRVSSLLATTAAGSGHPTSCLSAADIMAVLFFHTMLYNLRNYDDPDNDRFILSKGHASALLYAAWKEVGLLTEDNILSYRKIGSNLEGHPTLRFPYAEAATGSLGIGLSIGVGIALNARLDKAAYHTYVLLGDSEISEGSVWEAVELAAHYKLDNLIATVDCNRLGQSTQALYGHNIQKYVAIFEAFGWRALTVNGHSIAELVSVFDQAQTATGKPTVILAKTTKGYGIERVADKMGFHGKVFKQEELDEILQELKETFADAASYEEGDGWAPSVREQSAQTMACKATSIEMPSPIYECGDMIPTRKAYGQALVALGGTCDTVVSLDGEVSNSTFAELFAQKYPDRFFECFIAEQNMVGMGVGLARRGKIPFVSTFGAFFTRAHDQVRMAAIGQSNVRLVGSHVGVSIGQDGPSQMALEDIALMRALPESIVLYPSDAVSAYKLVEQMAHYEKGISYMRTTRAATPIIYDNTEQFLVGGCKVLRESGKDKICIVGAGITLHEALKAYDTLQEQGISVSVIDLYSVKPLDEQTLIRKAKESGNKILVVEDHYAQGGMGEAVRSALWDTGITVATLAVTQLPRSGQPEELLAQAGIDAAAITQYVTAQSRR